MFDWRRPSQPLVRSNSRHGQVTPPSPIQFQRQNAVEFSNERINNIPSSLRRSEEVVDHTNAGSDNDFEDSDFESAPMVSFSKTFKGWRIFPTSQSADREEIYLTRYNLDKHAF